MKIFCVLVICLLIVADIDATEDFNDDTRTGSLGEVVGDELRSLGQPQRRNQKLLMNLGGFFGEPFCTSSGSPIGICKNELVCVKEKGTLSVTSQCNFLLGSCCQYHRECGGSSGQRVIYWQSHDYPTERTEPGVCRFTLEPAANVCYIKVEFLDLFLDAQVEQRCMANALYILNMEEGNGSPFCGPLTGYEIYAKVKYTDTLKLATFAVPVKFFINVKTTPYKFQVRLTQVPCDQVDTFTGRRKKRDVPEGIMTSAPKAATREGRRNDNNEILLPNLSLRQTSAENSKNLNLRRRHCVDGNARSLFPPPATPLKFAFPFTNIFTQIIENQVNKDGLALPTRIAPPNPITDITTDYPWMGYMLLKRGYTPLFFCGAVLISDTFALTAAHCVTKAGYTASSYDIRVRFGRTSLGSTPVDRQSLFDDLQTLRVNRVVLHAMHDIATLQYDVALLELSSSVSYSPVNLPKDNKSYDGASAKLLGWGFTAINGDISPSPNSLEVTIMNNDVCDQLWKKLYNAYSYTSPRYIQKDMICSNSDTPNAGICTGDSGGPLVVEESSGSYTLVGIISGAHFSCTTRGTATGTIGEYPDISTRLSEVLDFINVATSKLFN